MYTSGYIDVWTGVLRVSFMKYVRLSDAQTNKAFDALHIVTRRNTPSKAGESDRMRGSEENVGVSGRGLV